MPFGIMNANVVFPWLVLSGLKFMSVYLDDVIVYSESLEDHVNHLRIVFEYLRTAGLKLNLQNVSLFVMKWGTLITPVGLKPSE